MMSQRKGIILLLWTVGTSMRRDATALPACDSEIWCNGPILEAVQDANLYADSKTFVDMNLKYDPDVVISAFANLSATGTPSKAELRTFVSTYFEGPNMEFEKWTPADYKASPAFLTYVKDEELRNFGKSLCQKWSNLGRKIKQDVNTHQDRYSLIYLKHPFIVPGGRFRETYYWDSYWVIKGLLTCEMKSTVKGMLENFISMIKRYGMVPNGNRIYYTRRSQPPLLIPMVDLYMEATDDMDFLLEYMPYLAEEYKFWMVHRSLLYSDSMHSNLVLNRYSTPNTKPRPESYREDKIMARKETKANAPRMFQNLASTAESGWDFSSRWFSEGFQRETEETAKWLVYTDTTSVIPVDLNSILCWNEKLMAKFYNRIGELNASANYAQQHTARQDTMMNLFWDPGHGTWFDVSLRTKSRRTQFFPSNVFPLFVGCYKKNGTNVEKQVLQYLKNRKVLEFKSGVPTSLLETGQQWDYPNAWPPLQDVVISALANGELEESRQIGLKLATQWVQSNYKGWKRSDNMFEKYVVTAEGCRGSGCEYNVQDGFGWTNGLILDLLQRFGQNLTLEHSTNNGNRTLPHYTTTTSISMTFLLFCCFSYFFTKQNLL